MKSLKSEGVARVALAFVLLFVATCFAPGPVPSSAQTRGGSSARQRRAPGSATRAGGARAQAGPPAWRAALEAVSAESMKGHLSFLASDALEGRRTPSRGLDIAAEYIAAQFRRAGLEPVGDEGYFQTAKLADVATSERARARLTPEAGEMKVRNVAGVLRGSDPALRDTYVVVSAHYDHIGVRENCDSSREDCVNNGANDDGSGTVGVIELASALSKLARRPKRSILFLTFFGEELGLVGSRYYGRHPLVPLGKTVAQVNMEQIGRTDDGEGPQVGTLAVTGFDFSEVGDFLRRAGESEGVRVYRHPTKSDSYFSRSDNQSLADAGVPAHTAGVAFEFPDYHAVGDHWDKIDYANMARVVRAVGRAALLIADSAREPRWDEQNPKAARYVEAWKKLHGK
ncbi:MAG: M28 family peptidase [Pyrinomonadaceae bacterium]